MSKQVVYIEGIEYPVNTTKEIEIAEKALTDAGKKAVPVFGGQDQDQYKTCFFVFSPKNL